MALTQRLDLRQTQALVMTPQLQQAIKLLQLSNLEVVAFVESELERNPLLERDENLDGGSEPLRDGAVPALDQAAELRDREQGDPYPSDRTGTDRLVDTGTLREDGPLDADFGNVWDGETGPAGEPGVAPPEADTGGEGLSNWNQRGPAPADDDRPFDATLAANVSLRDHLVGQINLELNHPADRLIALALLDLLDDAGYLTADLDAVAEQLNCGRDRVEAILGRLQAFEPVGVFARSLTECLAIQLADRDRLDPAMQALLDNLELVARRDLAALTRVCGVDAEDIADMVAEIRALNPKPALAFGSDVAQPVVPDVLMRANPAGGWIVELNSETLPRVLVNQAYHAEVSANARSKVERDYIAECFATASWLTKSLHQRATTILRVASEIVRQQDAFFLHGVSHLKPLILRDIAEAIGMHESTVSRVTSNKFIATPRGIFELKYFFTPAIPGANGADAHSAEAVRFRIKALIDGELARQILSDDRIVEILRADGIDIARRTVAKYREAMRIPSSVQRRRDKCLGV